MTQAKTVRSDDAGTLSRVLHRVLASQDAVIYGDEPAASLLINRLAEALVSRRSRVIRAEAAATSLSLGELIAQVTFSRSRGEHDDHRIEQAFRTLTVPHAAVDRIVLLITTQAALPSSTLRYLQLACRMGPRLRLVVAGPPGCAAVPDTAELAPLRTRLTACPPLHLSPASMASQRVRPSRLAILRQAGARQPLLIGGCVSLGIAATAALLSVSGLQNLHLLTAQPAQPSVKAAITGTTTLPLAAALPEPSTIASAPPVAPLNTAARISPPPALPQRPANRGQPGAAIPTAQVEARPQARPRPRFAAAAPSQVPASRDGEAANILLPHESNSQALSEHRTDLGSPLPIVGTYTAGADGTRMFRSAR